MSAPKKVNHRTYAARATEADDRRSICRYTAVETRAWLGWWEGEAFHSTDARLVDISLRGCMMTVDRLPPKDQAVWFCPPGTSPVQWIEARLVESKRHLFGPRVVRIEFHKPFSYDAFKHLVYGPDALGGHISTLEPVPESERTYW
jgi:hypothetical protein